AAMPSTTKPARLSRSGTSTAASVGFPPACGDVDAGVDTLSAGNPVGAGVAGRAVTPLLLPLPLPLGLGDTTDDPPGRGGGLAETVNVNCCVVWLSDNV